MRYSLLLVTLLTFFTTNATTRRVLFLGNSYTQFNNLPSLVENIASSLGDTLIFSSVTPGGFTLQGHATNAASINAIKQQKWDIVVIQAQSQEPSFNPTYVANNVYPYAMALADTIRSVDTCTEVMFYMTWGRKNGDASNCGSYTPVCTYEGMQQKLRERYLQMTQDNKANVAPVGAAWKMTRDSASSIELYNPDESHPSLSGSYLAACVFYASIFHKDPYPSNYNGGVTPADAEKLRYYAGKTTTDSIYQWQQHGNYVRADMEITLTSITSIRLKSNSEHYTSIQWMIDGNPAGSNPNFLATGLSAGKHVINLIASNGCHTEVITDTVELPLSVLETKKKGPTVNIVKNYSGQVTFTIENDYNTLSVYNTDGRKVYQTNQPKQRISINIPQGLYVYKVTDERGKSSSDKFIVK